MIATISGLRARRRELFCQGLRVALVPTMGALHEGHLALVRRGRQEADEVWVSIFVNPTQFGPGEDFDRYPRNLERDAQLLQEEGVSLLFAPSVREMYPQQPQVVLDFPGLSAHLCGVHRPGHFQGVALVVAKLFNIVQPEVAVFGAKDFQQATLIRKMVEELNFPIRIVVVPTVREKDGLAMSSRNAYLSPQERGPARALSRALQATAELVRTGERRGRVLESYLLKYLRQEKGVRPQYVAAVDPDTLVPLELVQNRVLLAVAAFVGNTRLIDNLLVEVAQ